MRRTGGTAYDSIINSVSVKEVGQHWNWDSSDTEGAWSTDGTKAICDGTQTGNISFKNTSNSLIQGRTYKITYDISNYVSGDINPHIKGTSTGNVNGNGLKTAIDSANEMLQAKDYLGATKVFKAIIEEDKNLPGAYTGLIKSLLGERNINAAKLASKEIPPSLKNDTLIKAAIAQINLTEQTLSVGNLEELREKFLKSPNDINLEFDLALALISEEKNTEAISTLLHIIAAEPDWTDGKAKTQLIDLLDALGPTNETGRAGRRKLSSLMFS